MAVPLLPIFLGGAFTFATNLPNAFAWKLYLKPTSFTIGGGIDQRRLTDKIEALRSKLSISKPILAKEIPGSLPFQAQGTSLLPGAAGIVYDPGMLQWLSDGELEFVLAHELCHIRSNDFLIIGASASIIGMITTLAISILFPSFALLPATTVWSTVVWISLFTLTLISRWRETCADKQAFAVCSPEGRQGAISFFEKLRNASIQYRNEENIPTISKIWRKIIISAKGSHRTDLLHPSFNARIAYLRAEANRQPLTV